MKIIKVPSKKSWGYIIPALFLIAGIIFLLPKSNGGISGVMGEFVSGGYKSSGYFTGGKMTDGLDVRAVRWHKHEGYERLVFDIYAWDGVFGDNPFQQTNQSGLYQIGKEDGDALSLDGELSGYRAFSAKMPNFKNSKFMKKMQVFPSDENSFLFTISLKSPATYKVFTLKSPARIIIDIK